MAQTAPEHEPANKNSIDRTIEGIAKVLSYSFAVSIVVTIYDVTQDVLFHSPTVWVYDVVTTAIAVAFLIGGSYAFDSVAHRSDEELSADLSLYEMILSTFVDAQLSG